MSGQVPKGQLVSLDNDNNLTRNTGCKQWHAEILPSSHILFFNVMLYLPRSSSSNVSSIEVVFLVSNMNS